MTSDDTNPPPLPPMQPLNEPDGSETFGRLVQAGRAKAPRSFPGSYFDFVPRDGETWIRREDGKAEQQRVEIQAICPRCGEYRASFWQRTAGTWFDTPTMLTSYTDNAEVEVDDHGVLHIRCATWGCRRINEQVKPARIAACLAAMARDVGRDGHLTVHGRVAHLVDALSRRYGL